MSKFAIAGVAFVIFGFLAIGYSGIQSFMGQGVSYESVLVVDLLDPDFVDRMDGASWHGFQKTADTVLELPLYGVCFVIGAVLLIISSFLWKK